jgi:hypothetical protein
LLIIGANPTCLSSLKRLKPFQKLIFLRVLVHFIFLFLAGLSMKSRKKIARHQGNCSKPMPASATVILESDYLSILCIRDQHVRRIGKTAWVEQNS